MTTPAHSPEPNLPQEGAAVERSGPSRKAIFGWGVAMLAALGLAWFAGAVVWPVWEVRGVIQRHHEASKHSYLGSLESSGWELPSFPVGADAIRELGGPEAATRKLNLYLRMPEVIAPHKSLAPELWRGSKGGGKAFLIKALSHPEPIVRVSAASSLGNIDSRFVGQDEIAALADATADEDAAVRYCAVVALGNLGSKACTAIPVLEKALHDKGSISCQTEDGTIESIAIKQAAEEALRRIQAAKEPKGLNQAAPR